MSNNTNSAHFDAGGMINYRERCDAIATDGYSGFKKGSGFLY